MPSISCPFCGEHMDPPLPFCQACGRPITAEDLKRSGLKLQSKRPDSGRSEFSKRDFTFQRKMRSVMYSVSAMLALLIGYYFVMKYILHEHMPGNFDVTIEQVIAGVGSGTAGNSAGNAPGDVTVTPSASRQHQQ